MLWDPKNDKPIEVELDEIGQVMWKAADYLETHRWGQGDFVLANGAVCLMGALRKIENGTVYPVGSMTDNDCPLAEEARSRIRYYLNLRFRSDLYEWNDAPERKKSEVIAVLREAAKLK